MSSLSKLFTSLVALALIWLLSSTTIAKKVSSNEIKPIVVEQIFDKAKKNTNWKLAFATGKAAQVVFMNVSPSTNPANEIGLETHKFDQVIFIAEGHAKVILNGAESEAKAGDMIFVPQGVAHNVINLNDKQSLKVFSVYSSTDIPANSTYKKKSDAE